MECRYWFFEGNTQAPTGLEPYETPASVQSYRGYRISMIRAGNPQPEEGDINMDSSGNERGGESSDPEGPPPGYETHSDKSDYEGGEDNLYLEYTPAQETEI